MMKFNKIVVTLILLFLAQNSTLGALDKFRLTIAYIPNIQFTPLYVGQVMGFFEQEGIDLTIDYAMGSDTFNLLIGGKSDAALADGDQFIKAVASGLDVQLFFQYYNASPISLVSINPNITKPADLAGKTVGVPEMMGASYLNLLIFLNHHNLTDKVTIERVGYSQVALLQGNKLDAAVVYTNNEAVFLQQDSTSFTEWVLGDIVQTAPAGLVASRQTLQNQADLYKRFSRALSRSIRFVWQNSSPSLAIFYQVVPQANIGDSDLNYAMLKKTIPFFSRSGIIDINQFNSTQQIMQQLKLIDKPVALNDFIAPA
jgi:NitT/TauT family transport system substrate-binding protein